MLLKRQYYVHIHYGYLKIQTRSTTKLFLIYREQLFNNLHFLPRLMLCLKFYTQYTKHDVVMLVEPRPWSPNPNNCLFTPRLAHITLPRGSSELAHKYFGTWAFDSLSLYNAFTKPSQQNVTAHFNLFVQFFQCTRMLLSCGHSTVSISTKLMCFIRTVEFMESSTRSGIWKHLSTFTFVQDWYVYF